MQSQNQTQTATATSKPQKPARAPRNGVNTPALLATINAVKETPAAREVPVSRQQPLDERHVQRVAHRIVQRRGRRARASRPSSATTPIIRPCSSAQDRGPTPVEFLLHGLAACITAGIAQHRRGARRDA